MGKNIGKSSHLFRHICQPHAGFKAFILKVTQKLPGHHHLPSQHPTGGGGATFKVGLQGLGLPSVGDEWP